ncbi:MAG: DUF5916 domain-containing protein [Pyrinomonadaceae bacterium]
MRKSACFIVLVLCLCAAHGRAAAQEKAAETKAAETEAKAEASPAPPTAGTTRVTPGETPALPPEKSAPVTVARFEAPPVIDGKLDDEVWKGAAVLKDFYQTDPGYNIAPSKPTEVLIGYDARFLYFGFRAYDEPDKVRSTVAKRDSVAEDDNVRIILDTYNDQRRAYILIFNPLGVQQDGILTEGSGEDYSVDILMESKGVITSDGYTVEVAVPFKSLRYHSGKDQLWGVHAYRRIKRFNNELDSWMPISRNISGLLNQAGHITGLEEISAGRTLELIPSLTLSQTGRRVRGLPPRIPPNDPLATIPDRFINPSVEMDPGLTAKLGITPTITLDLALNPDFAQVEADQTVVTANQRFPIFFEEKRPFFLEGIEIFRTPLTVVHTRAIVDPDAAVKLSGKRGRNTFGLLLASDNAPGNYTEDERTEIRQNEERFLIDPVNTAFDDRIRLVDRNAQIGILRVKRDVGKDSNIGFIATAYGFPERHNYVAGFDGRVRLNQQTTVSFQVLGTHSRRFFFDAERGGDFFRTGNGFAYYLYYEKAGKNLNYNWTSLGRTRDYRASVGFTRRVNTNYDGFFVSYGSDPKPKAKFVSWRVFNAGSMNYDWQGRMQTWIDESQAIFSFKYQGYVGVGFVGGYDRIFEEEFGPVRTATRAGTFAGPDPERSTYRKIPYIYGGITPSKKYSLFVNLTRTYGELDFDFGAGPRYPRVSPAALADPNAPLDPGPGKAVNLFVSFSYQPTDALRASLDYTKSKLVRNDTGRTAFDVNIYALRATYQFSRFTFARARLDYDTLASNLRTQFLLGWTPNPGTSFYAGYNDDLNRNGFSPFTGQLEPGFRRNGRTFFIKMSYLIRRNLE